LEHKALLAQLVVLQVLKEPKVPGAHKAPRV